ncbi:hypothetical protein BT10792_30535 (plasmid) [Bacillus thuringiensis]|nr:hypothetical protein BT10792_30535 [Bacillus thuringiensis]
MFSSNYILIIQQRCFYFFYRIYTLNIYLYALHCYYTLRNSNKKMIPIKLYKNKKNPNRGNSL